MIGNRIIFSEYDKDYNQQEVEELKKEIEGLKEQQAKLHKE